MHRHPIYTREAECQDCYRCLRHCPVKAIKVEGAQAAILDERCVLCGQCVEACPSQAKRIRDDLSRARNLLATRRQVYVSLAPSYASEFPGVAEESLVSALMRLGFAGVSETALGAQQVSLQLAEHLRASSERLFLSSACPAAVGLVEKYFPEKAGAVLPLLSPAQAHAKLLRKRFGADMAWFSSGHASPRNGKPIRART